MKHTQSKVEGLEAMHSNCEHKQQATQGLGPTRESDLEPLQQDLESSLLSPQGLCCQWVTHLGQAAGMVSLDR